MQSERIIRVGNAGGYWGDDLDAMRRQLSGGSLDYLSLDFLAEITMSILQKQRSRNPSLGYAADFVDQVDEVLPLLTESGTRLISNAGGINPSGCAQRIAEGAKRSGAPVRIGVVEGDDLMDRIDDLLTQGVELKNMETGAGLRTIRDRVESANVYLGAAPVMKALELGAQIVVTGRVTDTGIAVSAPAFEYGWDAEDWNRLASAVVAGHILECGAQSTGGNLTDWREIPTFQNMGYPIAEFSPDGSFVITKHPGTGGRVSFKTVAEQLVYEMGKPTEYITPDVVADFSTIRLEEVGGDRVRVSGIQGRPRTRFLKVSISYTDGYKAHGTLIVSRPEAVEKCRRIADILWKRLGIEFADRRVDLIGYNACHQHLAPPTDPPEVLLRMGVRDADRDKVEAFSKKFTSVILNTMPGAAIVGARPRVQDVVAYWPCLIPAELVEPRVSILDQPSSSVSVPWNPPRDASSGAAAASSLGAEPAPEAEPSGRESRAVPSQVSGGETRTVRLDRLAFARSGDKGDTCNIGIVARSPAAYQWMVVHLTAQRVKSYFGDICRGEVERYEVPNLRALNFLLHESLGGGGTLSLGIDPQGKTYSHALLMMEVEVPAGLLSDRD